MTLVGLTGGVACGKSAVARILAARGVPVIDADQVAREVVRPGTPALSQIVAHFGPTVLAADGQLDRPAMRARIVREPEARRALEAITHPAIRDAVTANVVGFASAGHDLVVVEAALMVETGSYRIYPELIVVTCDPQTQLDRLVARDGGSPDDAAALVRAQLPLADKERVATHLIHNDGDLAALEARTDEVLAAIRRR